MSDREKLVELLYDNNVRCDQKIEGLADDVMDIVAHGVTVQEWIPIKDRLPEVGEYVQTIDKWGHIHDRKLYRFKDGFLCFQPDGLKPGADITHWAYPPEPPDGWERRTDGYGCYQRKPEPPKGG